jgi:hypothetical protein
MSKSEDMKVVEARLRKAIAELDELIAKLEKPKQWEPRGGEFLTYVHCPTRRTSEAAEKARDAMRTQNRLLAYVDEFSDGWEADWSDDRQAKYSVRYSHISKVWSMSWDMSVHIMGIVHMSEDCAKGLIAKLKSGEVVL